jgi:hypothetical protein
MLRERASCGNDSGAEGGGALYQRPSMRLITRAQLVELAQDLRKSG